MQADENSDPSNASRTARVEPFPVGPARSLRVRSVVFDLDGTLIDSAPDLGRALNRMLAELRRPLLAPEAVVAMIGDGAAALVDRALDATGGRLPPPDVSDRAGRPSALEIFLAHYNAEPVIETRLYPGVGDVLEGLRSRGFVLGLCTNKPEAPTRAILKHLSIDGMFAHVCGGDGVPVRKPHPGHVVATLHGMGASRDEAAMVGDSVNDVAAAKAVPVPVVAVSYGYSRVPVSTLGADYVIDTIAALPLALAALRRG